MNSESSQRLGFDLHALDVVLDSLTRAAADPTTDRNEFYATINQKIVACTESLASSVLLKNSEGQVRIVNQSGWSELDSGSTSELKNVVKQTYSLPARSGHASSNVLSRVTAFVSHSVPQNGMHFVYLLVRSNQENEFAKQVFGDLTNEIASQIEAFENLRSADQKPQSILELTQIAQLVQNLGKSTSLSEMSFNLVNDLSKITHADRVTYVANSGKIKAVSGVSRVSFRTAVARTISKLARVSLSSGGTIEWSNGEINVDGKRSPRGLSQLVEELPSVAGYSIPVKSSNRTNGVLVVEYFTDEQSTSLERREIVNEAIKFASPVIHRSVEFYSIPAIHGLDALFNRFLVKPIRAAILAAVVLLGIAACLYLLFGFQRPFEIYGEGTLQTTEDRHVFAQIEGEVEEMLVHEGSFVEKGQRLLVVNSENLAKELITVEGEIEEAKQEMRNLMLSDFRPTNDESSRHNDTKTASDIERLKIRLETLNERLAFFEDKKSRLEILAPIAGQITTPNLRQRLTDRPLDRGDLLMTVSDTHGQWEIELQIPDNRVEFVKNAQAQSDQPLEVIFRLASDSQQTYVGKLSRLDYRSDNRTEQQQTMVMAFVEIDEPALGESLRLGTRVYGKISCGKRNNFFLLTYEAKHKIQEWLFH